MIRAAANYLQSTSFESLYDALDRIRELPEHVLQRQRVALICSRETAKKMVDATDEPPSDDVAKYIVRGMFESSELPADMNRSCFQRLRAGSKTALVIGSFDGQQRSMTGSLALLLQHYGLRRGRAAEYEAKVAAGQVLVCVSCADLPGEVCEAIYELLTERTSPQQACVATS